MPTIPGLPTGGIDEATDLLVGYDATTGRATHITRAALVSALSSYFAGVGAGGTEGVTNGDSHDHTGGDGAQIDHVDLANKGTNTHAQIDTAIATINVIPTYVSMPDPVPTGFFIVDSGA